MSSKYNPNISGSKKAFNHSAPQILSDITPDQRAKAQARAQKVITDARQKLNSRLLDELTLNED